MNDDLQEVPYGGDPGCFWHGPEPIPEGAFRVCGECWHCWPTADDFEADVETMFAEVGVYGELSGDPIDLPYCPLCAHDF